MKNIINESNNININDNMWKWSNEIINVKVIMIMKY